MRRRTIRALEGDLLALHRVAWALVAGRFHPDVFRGGFGSPLRLVERPAPERPTGWVRIEPTLSGVCASDRKGLHITGLGTTITALFGVPRRIVPGHEVVGVVTEADPGAGVAVGDRVVAEPTLSCEDKGLPPCDRCRAGDDEACERVAVAGRLTPGHGFGHGARYGGGWAQEVVAPARRVLPVPDGLDDTVAVLAEPMAVAVHAAARNLPRPGDRVLVIGPGTIGLCLVHALTALAPEAEVTVAGISRFSDDLARAAGATGLLHGTRRELVEAAASRLGSPVHGNRVSGPVLERGFDVVFDAVGSTQTIDDAARMTRPRGRLVLVAASVRQEVDWTLVWTRELTLSGTAYYGEEEVPADAEVPAGRRRATAVALDVLAERRPPLVTHVFPLEDHVAALRTSDAGPGARAVKVAFDPR